SAHSPGRRTACWPRARRPPRRGSSGKRSRRSWPSPGLRASWGVRERTPPPPCRGDTRNVRGLLEYPGRPSPGKTGPRRAGGILRRRIVQVAAFTDRPFAGNPAAVCVLPGPADERWMQDVAREMNLSETSFLHRLEDGYRLRWFTPAVEVDLCGHATLAA